MNSKGMRISMSEVVGNKNTKKNTNKSTANAKVRKKSVEIESVSLKEIKEVIQNKVKDNQKQNVVKKVLVNIGIAIVMIVYLLIVMLGTKNIDIIVLEKDLKILTIGILALGILFLERAYKKDNIQMALFAVEILVFGAINLCLAYVINLNFSNIINIITYIGAAIAVYYIAKSIVIAINNVRKYKKENNDIKEIIKK